jgi:hypothetical protein
MEDVTGRIGSTTIADLAHVYYKVDARRRRRGRRRLIDAGSVNIDARKQLSDKWSTVTGETLVDNNSDAGAAEISRRCRAGAKEVVKEAIDACRQNKLLDMKLCLSDEETASAAAIRPCTHYPCKVGLESELREARHEIAGDAYLNCVSTKKEKLTENGSAVSDSQLKEIHGDCLAVLKADMELLRDTSDRQDMTTFEGVMVSTIYKLFVKGEKALAKAQAQRRLLMRGRGRRLLTDGEKLQFRTDTQIMAEDAGLKSHELEARKFEAARKFAVEAYVDCLTSDRATSDSDCMSLSETALNFVFPGGMTKKAKEHIIELASAKKDGRNTSIQKSKDSITVVVNVNQSCADAHVSDIGNAILTTSEGADIVIDTIQRTNTPDKCTIVFEGEGVDGPDAKAIAVAEALEPGRRGRGRRLQSFNIASVSSAASFSEVVDEPNGFDWLFFVKMAAGCGLVCAALGIIIYKFCRKHSAAGSPTLNEAEAETSVTTENPIAKPVAHGEIKKTIAKPVANGENDEIFL